MNKPQRRGLQAAALLCAVWLGLRCLPLPSQNLENDWGYAALDSEGGLLRLGLSPGGNYRIRVALKDMSPALVRGFVAYEDSYFRWHLGINPFALVRAAFQNIRSGHVVSGASTIPMQLAKLMDRRPRTYAAKLLEVLRALQLEARFSKDELLELYLNSVPQGGNIEGVGAASLLYFGKPVARLSAAEAALLISLPKNPVGRRPDRWPAAAKRGRDIVLKRVASSMGVDSHAATSVPIPMERLANPDLAPHLSRRLEGLLRLQGGASRLSLQPRLQSICEAALARAIKKLSPQGIKGGAIIIVENASRKVRAYVGGPEFTVTGDSQVNGAYILRSPGSTLKPFLYALSMQAGLVTPKSLILDIPRDYGGYHPGNFTGLYAGPVSAEEALDRSLNTPAVWLESQLRRLGKPSLESWLRQYSLGHPPDVGQAGLSVALGAWPVTLETMVAAYAMLADQGRLRGLNFFEDQNSPGPGLQALSPEASYLALQMLSEGLRPDLPATWEDSPNHARIAFKTGTSFGLRDFWCMAVTPRYTIGVWLGNPNASGAPQLSAAMTASPLAFSLLNPLMRQNDRWFDKPAGVGSRQVCSLSGQPPGPDCERTESDDFIVGLSPILPCAVHKRVWVRKKDGKRLTADCLGDDPALVQSRVFEAWPPDVAHFMRSRGMAFKALPPPAEGCASLPVLPPPRVISPSPGSDFELKKALPLESQRLPLTAQCSPGNGKLYWIIDGKLAGEGKPDETLFWEPEVGKHDLVVLDSEGGSGKSGFSVEMEADAK